jgi:hypothetical protein
MMLLATLCVIPAATSRIIGLPELYAATIWGRIFGPFFVAAVVGAVFLVAKWVLTRSYDRWYSAGFAAVVLVWALAFQIAHTDAWGQFATALVR